MVSGQVTFLQIKVKFFWLDSELLEKGVMEVVQWLPGLALDLDILDFLRFFRCQCTQHYFG